MQNIRKAESSSAQTSATHEALPADRGIREVVEMQKRNHDARTHIDLLSASITNWAGSGRSILVHLAWFVIWLSINLGCVPGVPVFDPFPFSFLTMVVSLEAIFLTLFVLVSQNRMSQEADKRAHLDLQINILAERETTMILRMLNEISDHLQIKSCAQSDLEELEKETRIQDLAQKLDDALPPQ